MPRPKNAIIVEFVRILKALRAAEGDRERRTMLLRDLAIETVDLREHFITEDGRPDWTGRTWAYRDLQRQLYSDAGYPPDQARATQASARYHTGNLIRERLGPDEREDLGIQEASPLDRSRAARERRDAIVRAVDGADDVPTSLQVARDILSRVTGQRLAELDANDAAQVRELVAEITPILRRITRQSSPTRKGA